MLSKINKIVLCSVLSAFFLLPHFANAQSISLTSNQAIYKVGDDIPVVLSIDTSNKSVNVVEATVNFPTDFFDVQSIETGNSFLTLWPQRPAISDNGTISFTGGVPHGFNGSNGNIFSFILKSKKIGIPLISINDATILLNDGLGTKLDQLTLAPLKIEITSPQNIIKPAQPVQQPIVDKIKPLPFTPVVSRNSSVAGNKYFVSFSAIDKETGVSYYEVREEYVLAPYFGAIFSTNWQKSETPYILKLQHWWSEVYVRAYDGAGNFRQEVAFKPLDKEGSSILNILIITIIIVIILLILIAIYIYFKLKNKNKKS